MPYLHNLLNLLGRSVATANPVIASEVVAQLSVICARDGGDPARVVEDAASLIATGAVCPVCAYLRCHSLSCPRRV